MWYKGLPGTDYRLAWEDDADFNILYLLYVAAMAASAAGLLMFTKRLQTEAWQSGSSRSYTMTLVVYFIANFIVNVVVQITFVRNRCNDHNVLSLLPNDAIPQTAMILPHEGWTDASTGMAKFSKALYLSMIFAGGFLTNTILQYALLKKVSLMGGSTALKRSLRCARIANIVLLLLNLVAMPLSFFIFIRMMDDGVGAVGGVDSGEVLTTLFNVGAFVFVALHVFISVVLMIAFKDISSKMGEAWAGTTKLLICAGCLIGSTLLCYGNMGLMLTNAYMLIPLDSVINDICIILLSIGETADRFIKLGFAAEKDFEEPSQEPKQFYDVPAKDWKTAGSVKSMADSLGNTLHSTLRSIASLRGESKYAAFNAEDSDIASESTSAGEEGSRHIVDPMFLRSCSGSEITTSVPAPLTPTQPEARTPASVRSGRTPRGSIRSGEDVPDEFLPTSNPNSRPPATPTWNAESPSPDVLGVQQASQGDMVPTIPDHLLQDLRRMQAKSKDEKMQFVTDSHRISTSK